MPIEPVEAVGHGASASQQTIGDVSPSDAEAQEYASFLDTQAAAVESSAPQAVAGAGAVEDPLAIPAPGSVETVQPSTAPEGVEAVEPNQAVEVLERVGENFARLDELISEIRSRQSFTVEEALGLQAEIHKLTFELNAATAAINAAVANVRTLFQTQV